MQLLLLRKNFNLLKHQISWDTLYIVKWPRFPQKAGTNNSPRGLEMNRKISRFQVSTLYGCTLSYNYRYFTYLFVTSK